jgi:glycosyltransferase involved in cell wall biosynthesis
MTVAEAMARSAIVLAPRWGPFPEFVTDGETGFLYEPGSADDAARCLEAVLGDAGLRERTGAAARDSVLARFAPRAALASLEEALRRVAASPAPDAAPPPLPRGVAPGSLRTLPK